MRSLVKFLSPLVAATCLAAANSASATEEAQFVTLEPSSPWNLDMGEYNCRIARLFGGGDKPTIFILDQWDPSTSANWLAAGPAFNKFRDGRKTNYSFSANGDAGEFDLQGSSLGDFGNAVRGSSTFVAPEQQDGENDAEPDYSVDRRGLPALKAKEAAGIEWLTLTQRGSIPVRLRLGSLEAPLAAMNVCMENLVEFWGFDLEEQRRVAKPPKVTNLQRVAREIGERYPRSAQRSGQQAAFHLRLTIGPGGSIEDCVLLGQMKADDFNLGTHPCAVFERFAKIEEARDVGGEPVRTYLIHRIVYRTN